MSDKETSIAGDDVMWNWNKLTPLGQRLDLSFLCQVSYIVKEMMNAPNSFKER